MKRYTLKVQLLDSSVGPIQFKQAIDELLIRTQPSLTYTLGGIHQTDSGELMAEIASDAKKGFLEARLKTLESKLPIQVEELGWGWIFHKASSPELDQPPVTFIVGTRSDLFRYVLLVSVPVVLIATIFLWYRPNQSGLYSFIIPALYFLWFFLWTDTPLDFRIHARQVDCLRDELVVNYRFRKEPIHLRWEDIWGLELKNRTCILTGKQKPVRFHVTSSFKPEEMDELIHAIAERADLYNVETTIGRVIHKRYDAP